MIIASAMKVHVESTDSYVIMCGLRHSDIILQFKLLGFHPGKEYKIVEQGFIDHKNNFLNRVDAWNHALNCGQLAANIIEERDMKVEQQLFSEDLW